MHIFIPSPARPLGKRCLNHYIQNPIHPKWWMSFPLHFEVNMNWHFFLKNFVVGKSPPQNPWKGPNFFSGFWDQFTKACRYGGRHFPGRSVFFEFNSKQCNMFWLSGVKLFFFGGNTNILKYLGGWHLPSSFKFKRSNYISNCLLTLWLIVTAFFLGWEASESEVP